MSATTSDLLAEVAAAERALLQAPAPASTDVREAVGTTEPPAGPPDEDAPSPADILVEAQARAERIQREADAHAAAVRRAAEEYAARRQREADHEARERLLRLEAAGADDQAVREIGQEIIEAAKSEARRILQWAERQAARVEEDAEARARGRMAHASQVATARLQDAARKYEAVRARLTEASEEVQLALLALGDTPVDVDADGTHHDAPGHDVRWPAGS